MEHNIEVLNSKYNHEKDPQKLTEEFQKKLENIKT